MFTGSHIDLNLPYDLFNGWTKYGSIWVYFVDDICDAVCNILGEIGG